MDKEQNTPSSNTILDTQDIRIHAIDRSPVPMTMVEGPEYIVRYVNPAFCRLVAKEDKDLINNSFAEALPEAANCMPTLNQVHLTGETQTCVAEVSTAPRSCYWSCMMWPVAGVSGSTEFVMVQVADTTEIELYRQKSTAMNEELMLSAVRQHELTEVAEKLNYELSKTRDELEVRVQERTYQLSQAYEELQEETRRYKEMEEKLRQSQKMEALGTLAGGVAHDFNNILSGILGFTEMAIEDTGETQVQKSLDHVLSSVKRAKELVKQILAFSRKADYARSPLSVTPIIEETIQLLRASIPVTIEVTFSSTAQSDTVIGSPTEIQQVIMNLSINASLAMEEKGGTLAITLSDAFHPYVINTEALSSDFLQITVSDTGAGMTPEVMQRAFDPFFTTREPGKGTGMGLSVVYGIVRNLNGEITVLSAPGEGSTFSIIMPKVNMEISPPEKETTAVTGGKETILFVEDEELLSEWATIVLEKLGYTVHTFRDPREALRVFSQDPMSFDMVITDQAMPNMAGSQLTQQILNVRKEIPVILCTGYQELLTREKAAEIGITEVLSKPLTKYELATAVRTVLDQEKNGQ